jgi:hypothetical protein
MYEFKLETPVAFIIFNRPDTTERVFAAIAKAKPAKLLVVADGARENRVGEAEKVTATRAIINRVDWDCEVLTNYSDVNLGCKRRVSSGIDWVFEQVEEAIILEDDCLPDPTFFRFCQELLERYRYDQRIGMISGDNFQFGKVRTDSSYYFSKYPHIWGWATWRRAWKNYDVQTSIWPEFVSGGWLKNYTCRLNENSYWGNIFQAVHDGKIDTWDYQWVLTLWTQGMISIIPHYNLISNIGFGVDATHTQSSSIYENMKVNSLSFPLQHPNIYLPHLKADEFTSNSMFSNSRIRKLLTKLYSFTT